jgi:uncharacterized protein
MTSGTAPSPPTLVVATNAPPGFHLLAKPTGATCNLDCTYCFFLSKEMLYPGSRFRMAEELLETYIRQLFAAHRTPEVMVAWQGGEPTLMGLDFFRRSVEYTERYRRPGQTAQYTIQTNGTLLDDDWCAFLKQHGFLVGLSLDGPRAIHDTYRLNKGGKGTFDQVMRAWSLLRKHGVEFNILCTIHAANADRPVDVYRFFRDELKARYLQFIPIIERATAETIAQANQGWHDRPGGARMLYTQTGTLVTERSVRPEQYGSFLIGIFDEWVRRDVGTVYVQMFDSTLANYAKEPGNVCIHQETCGLALALEHNGDVYSCDHFVEPRHRLGNIREQHLVQLVSSAQQRKFGRAKRDTLPKYCLECDVRFACHGGCPKDRFAVTPHGDPGLNYLCPSFKAYFHHVDAPMRRMAELIRQGRAPREIMLDYVPKGRRLPPGAFANTPRNAPCPCGSGKRFKQCHGILT